MSKKDNHCADCGKLIGDRSIRCQSCANNKISLRVSGENNPMFGKHHTEETKRNQRKKTLKQFEDGMPEETKKKTGNTLRKLYQEGKMKSWNVGLTKENDERVMKISIGIKKNPPASQFKVGHKPSKQTLKKQSKKMTENWQDEEFAKWMFSKQNAKPNKVEKFLDKLLQENFPNQFKCTGDGKVWIEGFNPDFVCNPSKKIIELYGDYWHNKPKAKEKDERRLKAYKKYGFKTLVIWQHELVTKNEYGQKLSKQEMINKIGGFF